MSHFTGAEVAAQRRKWTRARTLRQRGPAWIRRMARRALLGDTSHLERLPMSSGALPLSSVPFLTFFCPFQATSPSPSSLSQRLSLLADLLLHPHILVDFNPQALSTPPICLGGLGRGHATMAGFSQTTYCQMDTYAQMQRRHNAQAASRCLPRADTPGLSRGPAFLGR